MEYKIVDEDFIPEPPAPPKKKTELRLHAVTPNVKLKEWDGIPPYAVVAFIGYLLALAVLFSNQIVPYCVANFSQPQNCAPIFDTILPIVVAAIILGPVVTGAATRMGGNRTTALIFGTCATAIPALMLIWAFIF